MENLRIIWSFNCINFFWLWYRYQNWTLVSVPNTKTWFRSHTRAKVCVLVRDLTIILGKYQYTYWYLYLVFWFSNTDTDILLITKMYWNTDTSVFFFWPVTVIFLNDLTNISKMEKSLKKILPFWSSLFDSSFYSIITNKKSRCQHSSLRYLGIGIFTTNWSFFSPCA